MVNKSSSKLYGLRQPFTTYSFARASSETECKLRVTLIYLRHNVATLLTYMNAKHHLLAFTNRI